MILQFLNPDKCKRVLDADYELQIDLNCGNETRRNSKKKKHAVTIDNNLKFVTC